MKIEEVNACSLPAWYQKFKRCTIESKILDLPIEVVKYLKDDGTLVLPEGSIPTSHQYYNCDNQELDEDWKLTTQSAETVQEPKFDEFSADLATSITRLGGSVFPKLNWSSPKDASWIALNNSLECKFPGDIYLLLKSSNFITHDLTQPYKDCDDGCTEPPKYSLVLRQWTEINPSNEFRCFVKDKQLIGICQRDPSQHYMCIQNDQQNIKADIITFWRNKIENFFPSNSYVFDVYRPTKGRVVLVDFGPYGITTDSLLFNWVELQDGLPRHSSSTIIEESERDVTCSDPSNIIILNTLNLQDSNRIEDQLNKPCEVCDPEFRTVTNDTGVQPSPYMQYGLPTDIIELSTGQDAFKFIDFLQMKKNAESEESTDDEDDVEAISF